MISGWLSTALARRNIHYGWAMIAVTFFTALISAASVGAPGVFIVPMQMEFGWAPELYEQVIVDSLRGAAQAKAAWPLGGMVEDITADVLSIDVPVLVIAGEFDQVDPPATLQSELLPRIAGARMHVLPGTGHLSPLENPDEVAAAIHQFMQQLRT